MAEFHVDLNYLKVFVHCVSVLNVTQPLTTKLSCYGGWLAENISKGHVMTAQQILHVFKGCARESSFLI